MAAIWKLPCVFIIENNHFGMGTSETRASKSAQFYTRGDYIPGLWIDGMDVLAVKNGIQFARKFVLENGPIVLEMVSPIASLRGVRLELHILGRLRVHRTLACCQSAPAVHSAARGLC